MMRDIFGKLIEAVKLLCMTSSYGHLANQLKIGTYKFGKS